MVESLPGNQMTAGSREAQSVFIGMFADLAAYFPAVKTAGSFAPDVISSLAFKSPKFLIEVFFD